MIQIPKTQINIKTYEPKNLKTGSFVYSFFSSSVLQFFGFLVCVFYFWFFIFYLKAFAVSGTTLDPSHTLYTARQLGMGGVSVGFSDDANGVLSNPAGLGNLEFPQITAASRKLVLDETQYSLLGWALPTNFGTFGLGYVGMSTGGSLPTKLDPANNRVIIDPSREATAYNNNVIAVSYTKSLFRNLSIGANYKMYSQSLSGGLASNASGAGIGLGVVFNPLKWLSLGANLKNLSDVSLAWEGGASDTISSSYNLGAKFNLTGASQEALIDRPQILSGGFDYNLSQGNYNLGLEFFPHEKIALRTGLSGSGFTLGIGLINGGFRFDYAFASSSNIPGDSPHYFSLSYIGERVLTIFKKLKRKEPFVKITQPLDRLITDQPSISVSAEAGSRRVLDQKSIWTVTALSETHEVREVTETEDLINVSLNGNLVGAGQAGTIETAVALAKGRNIFRIIGYTSPEAITGLTSPEAVTGEVKVLCFTPFADTAMSHWAIEPIALSVTLGLIKGYPDDTFKPEKGITRAELITLLVRSMAVKADELFEFTEFSDVPATHWAAKYVSFGSAKKLVTGYPDGTFKPNKVLTRAEGVTILVRYAGISEEGEAKPAFMDIEENYWGNKYITPAKSAGLLKYITGEAFEPSAPFTRTEACEVLYRTAVIQSMVNQWWETGLISASEAQ